MRLRMPNRLGSLLLGIWLILQGLVALFGLSFQGLPTVMALLALVAGVLIILDR